MKYLIGCTGWSYPGWSGKFYPKDIPHSKWLKYYSTVFDITEINSTYYKIPSQETTQKWFLETPNHFQFTAKFPSKITHEKKLKNIKKDVHNFLSALIPLKSKISCLLLQLPPDLSFSDAKTPLEDLIQYLPNDFRYPIEGRHESWFYPETIEYLKENNLCQVWNEIEHVNNPAQLTSDYVYLRLIGDRSISDSEFGFKVYDKTKVIEKWAKRLNTIEDKAKFAIIMANNHLEGFAPETVNTLRMILDLPKLSWIINNQKSLLDF